MPTVKNLPLKTYSQTPQNELIARINDYLWLHAKRFATFTKAANAKRMQLFAQMGARIDYPFLASNALTSGASISPLTAMFSFFWKARMALRVFSPITPSGVPTL